MFLYLLTNPLTNICGVYEITDKQIAFDTGFSVEVVGACLQRFEKDGKLLRRDGWVAMRNWIKHQASSPQVQTGIERQLAMVPQELSAYVRGEGEQIPYTYAPPLNLTESNQTKLNSAVAKAPAECVSPDEEQDQKVNASPYSPTFEAFWAAYPRRLGKKKAYRCWLTCQKHGAHVVQLQNAVMNYAKECSRDRREEKFIKHAATFLGPDEPWKEYVKGLPVTKQEAPKLDVRICPNGHKYVHGDICMECGWSAADVAKSG